MAQTPRKAPRPRMTGLSESLEISIPQRKALRLGVLIFGRQRSPFAEGLFHYLTLLASGLKPGEATLVMIIAEESGPAFEIWQQFLAPEIRDSIVFNFLPPGVADSLLTFVASASDEAWIRSCEEHLDCWFSITPALPVLASFNKPVISLFADYLHVDYPTFYPEGDAKRFCEACSLAKDSISKFICFSEYVKRHQIVSVFKIPNDRVEVLPHAYFDYAKLAGSDADPKEAAERIRAFLQEDIGRDSVIVRDEWQRRMVGQLLKKFPFEDVPYVFMSTRARPHKNAITAIRAAELLLRSYADVKFFVTAGIIWAAPRDEFSEAVLQRGLQWDVISMNHVPIDVHAALYRCASVTVHPSPFEGGFPFTAFESVSSGTPVLLADGPVVREFLPKHAREDFVFNPTSPSDLAARIKWALSCREELAQRQHDTLSRFFSRTLEENTRRIIELAREAVEAGPAGVPAAVIGAHLLGINGDADQSDFFGNGWWDGEDWGRWACDHVATLRFKVRRGSNIGALELCLVGPPMPGSKRLTGAILIDREMRASFSLAYGETPTIRVPLSRSEPGSIVEVDVVSNLLFRPCDHDAENTDDRPLGVGVETIAFIEETVISDSSQAANDPGNAAGDAER